MIEKIKMPGINNRIMKLIQLYTKGNVSKFAKICNMANSQKLNRIFSIDSSSKKYPVPSTDIILDIAKTFSDIDLNWLIRGDYNSTDSAKVNEENITYEKENNLNIEEIIANKVADKLMPKINKLTVEIDKLESELLRIKSKSN